MPKNTILNYFNKVKASGDVGSPSQSSATPPKNSHAKQSDSPPKSHHSHSKREKSKSPSKSQEKSKQSSQKKKSPDKEKEKPGFCVGDLVWARVEGHPWWPAMVTPHPTSNSHQRKGEYHVQFFEENPTRAWVKFRNAMAFTGSKSGPLASVPDPDWKKGTLDANDALTMTMTQRLQLIREFPPSDEEDEVEASGSLGDSDQSKENLELSEEKGKKRKKSADKTKSSPSTSKSPPAKRRRARVIESDDEEDGDFKMDEDSNDEFKPPTDADESDDESDSASSAVPEEEISEAEVHSETEEEVSPPPKKAAGKTKGATESASKNWLTPSNVKKSANSGFTPASAKTTPASSRKSLAMFAADDAADDSAIMGEAGVGDEQWEHLKVDFLKPDKIKDGKGRRPGDPEYDPRTLHVPKSYLDGLSPGMRQWWDFKAENFDTILFFKVGKFYELYHTDAVVGVNELNLLFMKGKFAHSGFPEISYGRFADRLLMKGFKVARIEQTETPDQNKERCAQMGKRCTKWDKVVRRELCRVTTPATRLASFQDENTGVAHPKFLLAVSAKILCGPGENAEVGVCFVDTTVGRFHIGQFLDDRCFSRLRTLMSHFVPATILLERGKVSPGLAEAVKSVTATKEYLASESEFFSPKKTLKMLAEKKYFIPDGSKDDVAIYPDALKDLLEDGDGLALTPKSDKELCLQSLGAIVWYLSKCLIDDDTLSMRLFEPYEPVEWEYCQSQLMETEEVVLPPHIAGNRHLVLDGITMNNLDLLVNSSTGLENGTLIEQLDHCVTPFGKRLIRDWICRPLCSPDAINARLDAIEALKDRSDVIVPLKEKLRTLPDFQRLLPRVHSESSVRRNENHPDGRAVLFEMQKYSKKKIEGFLRILEGFKTVVALHEELQVLRGTKSTLLASLVNDTEHGGRFPILKHHLDFFDEAFDHKEARKNGNIIPARAGVDERYDAAKRQLDENARARDEYLREQSRFFGCKASYIGTGRNRFQIEVSDVAAKKADDSHELSSQRKGYRRFVTAETKQFVVDEMKAEDEMESALQDIGRSIMAKFDAHFQEWSAAVDCLAVLDTLVSFCVFSDSFACGTVRPEFVIPSVGEPAFLEIECGKHPCMGDAAIPNNIALGGSKPGFVLLTGPNMGGKSTFMRQAGLTTILAQMGCYVPAQSCKLTPVDRIFTRIGASDSIMKGESTFYVELSETSTILKHASPYSLVLVDELGRGTATFDGTAIASAVVHAMAQRECLTIFSTHYHSLVDELSSCDRVALSHMACMVEQDESLLDDEEADPTQETITFLYQNEPGPCPKSYGFNAARLAGLPDDIIRRGHTKAVEFEKCTTNDAAWVEVMKINSLDGVRDCLERLGIRG